MKNIATLLVSVSMFIYQPAKSQDNSVAMTVNMYADGSHDTLLSSTSVSSSNADEGLEFQNVVLSMEMDQLDEAYGQLVMKVDVIKRELEQYQKIVEQNNLKPERKCFECTNTSNQVVRCGDAFLAQVSPTSQTSTIAITYFVPQGFASAEVRIANEKNKPVVKHKVSEPYYGQAILNAGELEPGIYKYSLFVDGKEMDRKKLIITKERNN